MEYILGGGCIVLTLLLLCTKRNKKDNHIRHNEPRSLQELLSFLNFIIEQEITFKLKIELEIKKSTKIITGFNKELETLSKNINNSLSVDFLNELSYYVTREFIAKYIVRNIELYLIKHMSENQIINTK